MHSVNMKPMESTQLAHFLEAKYYFKFHNAEFKLVTSITG